MSLSETTDIIKNPPVTFCNFRSSLGYEINCKRLAHSYKDIIDILKRHINMINRNFYETPKFKNGVNILQDTIDILTCECNDLYSIAEVLPEMWTTACETCIKKQNENLDESFVCARNLELHKLNLV